MKGCAIFKVLIINDFKISLLKISVKKNNVLQKPCDSLLQFLQEKVYDMKIYLLLCFEILQWTRNLQIVFKGVKKLSMTATIPDTTK